jgi:hypothetical protein
MYVPMVLEIVLCTDGPGTFALPVRRRWQIAEVIPLQARSKLIDALDARIRVLGDFEYELNMFLRTAS